MFWCPSKTRSSPSVHPRSSPCLSKTPFRNPLPCSHADCRECRWWGWGGEGTDQRTPSFFGALCFLLQNYPNFMLFIFWEGEVGGLASQLSKGKKKIQERLIILLRVSQERTFSNPLPTPAPDPKHAIRNLRRESFVFRVSFNSIQCIQQFSFLPCILEELR